LYVRVRYADIVPAHALGCSGGISIEPSTRGEGVHLGRFEGALGLGGTWDCGIEEVEVDPLKVRVEGREVEVIECVECAVLPWLKSEPVGPEVGEGGGKRLIEGVPLFGN